MVSFLDLAVVGSTHTLVDLHQAVVDKMGHDKIWLVENDDTRIFAHHEDLANYLLALCRDKNGCGYNTSEEIITGDNHPLCHLCCEFSVRTDAPIIEFSHLCCYYFVSDFDIAHKVVDYLEMMIRGNMFSPRQE